MTEAKRASQATKRSRDEEIQFERSREYYSKNFRSILTQYEGYFIAIIDDEIVDSDEEFSELAKKVYAMFGYRDIFMPRVVREPETIKLRSPRIMYISSS